MVKVIQSSLLIIVVNVKLNFTFKWIIVEDVV